jgi:hypothetical protein
MQVPSQPKYKILCHINHFYGNNPLFTGKSSTQDAEVRKEIVEKCISQLSEIDGIDIKICGIEGYSLLPLDINFPNIKDIPTLLIYESITHMVQYLDEYDYFINIEDDILLPTQTFHNVIEYDRVSIVNEILHPNRLETDEAGNKFCIDIAVSGYWTLQRKFYLNREIRVNTNPHSGILIMSQAKLRYAISNIDLGFRGILLSKEMESAFAHFHSPFSLYRLYNDNEFHYIIHMDKWMPIIQAIEEKQPIVKKAAKYKIKMRDFFPPIMLTGYRYIKNKYRR